MSDETKKTDELSGAAAVAAAAVEAAQEEADWGDDDGELGALASGIDPGDESAQVEVTTADPNEMYRSATTFEEIGLSDSLLRGVYAMKFKKPSKIQAASLPLILGADHKNLIAQGHNGSGKTACFVLGMLARIDATQSHTQALCIVPTRELARQIADVVRAIGQFTETVVKLVVRETEEERRANRATRNVRSEAHMVIGTPGKLMDLVKRRQLDLSRVNVLVLDEADEMVNTQAMGDQTVRIKRQLPRDVQTLLFSATYDESVRSLATRVAPNANHIFIRRETLALDKISQYYMDVGSSDARFAAIIDVYDLLQLGQSIIFVRTRAGAQSLTRRLRGEGHTVSVLYGGQMTPEERDRVIDEFRAGTTRVLVTTNVLSRGVDVRAVTAVINYDLPTDATDSEADPETYLHRIGRTGRFGTKGVAINFVHDEKSRRVLKDLEKYYAKVIEKVDDVELLAERIKAI